MNAKPLNKQQDHKLDILREKIRQNLPIIDLLWIETIYGSNKLNEPLTERSLIYKLREKLPEGFSTDKLYHRLFIDYSKKDELSAVGNYLAGNDDSDLKIIDKIVKLVQFEISQNPELSDWNSDKIAEAIDARMDVVRSLIVGSLNGAGIISGYGVKENGAVNFHIEKNYYLTRLLHYKGIEDLLQDFYNSMPKLNNEVSIQRDMQWPLTESQLNDKVFKSEIESVDPKLVFVLMPFTTEWSKDVYDDLIVKNLNSLGLQCLRADSMIGTIVLEDIWIKINQAGLIIADVTGQNPNVMYELGIAHALHKKVMLMTQEIDKAPFDVKHLRHFIYKIGMKTSHEFGPRFKDEISKVYDEMYPGLLNAI